MASASKRSEKDNGGEEAEIRRLARLTSIVSEDGDEAVLTVEYENYEPLLVAVSLEEMSFLLRDLTHVSRQMVARQRNKVDRGESVLSHLIDNALEPSSIEIVVDKHTGDRVFLMQFVGHAPIALRFPPQSMLHLVEETRKAIRKTAN